MKRFIVTAILLAASALAPAWAQPSFPQKTVTFVVPLAAGGGTDIIARKVAQALGNMWGRSVIVENVPGASGFIGAQKVARAAPDGYTLFVTTNGPIVGNRFLYKSLPYDPDKDLIPVDELASIDMFVLANKSLPANNLKELVDLARKEPGKITYSSYGNGSQPQLLFELFNSREHIKLAHVPYKGIAPALTSVMAGETMLTLTGRGTGSAAIQSGKTKLLNYNSDARDPEVPDVPTSRESGYPYFKVSTWHGIFAPHGTPPDIIEKINHDVNIALIQPDFKAWLKDRAYNSTPGTPEQFATAIAEEVKATAEMVNAAGLTPQ